MCVRGRIGVCRCVYESCIHYNYMEAESLRQAFNKSFWIPT